MGDEPLPVSRLVDQCLGTDPATLDTRIAILRVGHAAQAVDRATEHLGAALAAYLQNPNDDEARDWAWQVLVESDNLLDQLLHVIREIKKSRTTLKELAGLRSA